MNVSQLERELVGRIVLSNNIHSKLSELCALGTRFPGSPGERAAQAFIMGELQRVGYQPCMEEFEHLAWERGVATLQVTHPVETSLTAVSLAGAPSTSSEGLSGEILYLGNGTPREFEERKEEIAGRIVLVTSLAPRSECSPPRQCHRRTKYGRAVAYGAKAFLFMNSQPGMLPQTGSTRQNMEGEIPAVTIPFEEGEILKFHLHRGPVHVILKVANQSFSNTTGNIVAELPGKKKDDIVIIGGHYDCHDNAVGALDNGSGVAMLLELASFLKNTGYQFEKTIRFVFFAVEEMASVGSSFYVSQHFHELDNVHLFINVDGVGNPGAKTFDTQGFDDLGQYIVNLSREMNYPMAISPPAFSGDSIAFVMGGVPTAALRRSSLNSLFGHEGTGSSEDRGWGHTPADTVDKVKPYALFESAIIAGRVLMRSADHSGPISRRRNEEEIEQLMCEHGMDEVLHFMRWPQITLRPRP